MEKQRTNGELALLSESGFRFGDRVFVRASSGDADNDGGAWVCEVDSEAAYVLEILPHMEALGGRVFGFVSLLLVETDGRAWDIEAARETADNLGFKPFVYGVGDLRVIAIAVAGVLREFFGTGSLSAWGGGAA